MTTTYAHSGSNSLHVVGIAGGAPNTSNSVRQVIAPLNTNTLCTLSFWYYTINTTTKLTVRTFPGSAITTPSGGLNQRPLGMTPGLTNSTFGSVLPYPPLWLNEVQSANTTGPTDSASQHDPWVEIYNAGTNVEVLDGLYLANDYTKLTQWAFPAGAVLQPGEFKLIWVDGETNPNHCDGMACQLPHQFLHGLGCFGADSRWDCPVVDYLNYSGLASGQSYGDFPDGQPFERRIFFTTPTPGAANHLAGECLYQRMGGQQAERSGGYPDPADGHFDDWFELYNPGSQPANIGGFYLTDILANPLQWRIPGGTIIPPGGFLLVWADKDVGENTNADLHADFNLAKGGEAIGLFTVSGTNIIQVDAFTFGAQTDNVSQGRLPGRASTIFTLSSTTPRGLNSAAVQSNHSPVLAAIANRVIYLGRSVDLTASATDSDAGQTLTYSLLPGFPAGASIQYR